MCDCGDDDCKCEEEGGCGCVGGCKNSNGKVQRITDVFVVAMLAPGTPCEFIPIGVHRMENGFLEARAGVEYHIEAISSMVEMCEEFVRNHSGEHGERPTFRLLKFSNPIELNPDDFEDIGTFCQRVSWTVH